MADIGQESSDLRDKTVQKWYDALREILRRQPMFLFPKLMKNLKTTIKNIVKRSPFEVATLGAIIVLAFYFVLPSAARAAANVVAPSRAVALEVAAMQNATQPFGTLPQAGMGDPTYTMHVTASAYNSEVAQCDDTPFITASGTHVRPGVIAANFLPIGTKVKITAINGHAIADQSLLDRVYTVEDRMNARYDKRIDIWMEERSDAIQFGVRTIAIEVYKAK